MARNLFETRHQCGVGLLGCRPAAARRVEASMLMRVIRELGLERISKTASQHNGIKCPVFVQHAGRKPGGSLKGRPHITPRLAARAQAGRPTPPGTRPSNLKLLFERVAFTVPARGQARRPILPEPRAYFVWRPTIPRARWRQSARRQSHTSRAPEWKSDPQPMDRSSPYRPRLFPVCRLRCK